MTAEPPSRFLRDMSFVRHLTRCPDPYEPDRGIEAARLFPELAPELRSLIAGTAGCSPYLTGLIEKERGWLGPALTEDPDEAFGALLAETAALEIGDLKSGLRRAKRRVALFVALADLGGVWTLEKATRALTSFADLAAHRALTAMVGAEIAAGKLPGMTAEDAETAAGTTILAMGKMGAFELNYSSDIDLIVLFDGDRYALDDRDEARSALVRATRRMTGLLSEKTDEGYVFRTDLRLRPDASVTPVCLSMDAAEHYYESVGRTWERASYIKARSAAGDISAGEGFLKRLTPFVWRRHLDYAAIRDAHDMRLRIRSSKGTPNAAALEGRDVKLGPGGIREIEFFVQTQQIIAGGREPDLRVRGTVEGLERLAAKGWVRGETVAALAGDYRALREVEHRLQMVADQQTHALPQDAAGFDRLASFMGTSADALREELSGRFARVNGFTEEFFAPAREAAGPGATPEMRDTIDRWSGYPALRSARAQEIFERLKPTLLERLGKAARPEEALAEFDRFLGGLPAGVQVFSMFEANPHLVDLIVDICATAPALARHLGRNPQVFDAVIDGAFFARWPGASELAGWLRSAMAEASDYERKLDAARRWLKEWHFRIGVHHLRGLVDAGEAGRQYSDLAEAVLVALWPVAEEEFSEKHGEPPGRGTAILGMGSLGASRLTAASDLDLIAIYDPQEAETSEGRRPLPARTYYSRLIRAFVAALSSPMSEGTLYEVDMRLRPSGRKGLVATSWTAYRDYQNTEAWTWEHLAMTRARRVAGNPALGEDVEAFRRQLLAVPRDAGKTLSDVSDMRARIADAKPAENPWEGKLGPGRMQDVELLAQTAALLSGAPERDMAGQLAAGVELRWLSRDEADALEHSHALFGSLNAVSRLLGGRELDVADAGEGGRAFLLRETGVADLWALEAELGKAAADAEAVIDAALCRRPPTR